MSQKQHLHATDPEVQYFTPKGFPLYIPAIQIYAISLPLSCIISHLLDMCNNPHL